MGGNRRYRQAKLVKNKNGEAVSLDDGSTLAMEGKTKRVSRSAWEARKKAQQNARGKANKTTKNSGSITVESNSIAALYGMQKTAELLSGTSKPKSKIKNRSDYEGSYVSENDQEEYQEKLQESIDRIHAYQDAEKKRELEMQRKYNESEEGKKLNAFLDAENKFEKENEKAFNLESSSTVYFSNDARKLAEQYLNNVLSTDRNTATLEIVKDNEYGGYRLRSKESGKNLPQLFVSKAQYNTKVAEKRAEAEAKRQRKRAEAEAKKAAEEQAKKEQAKSDSLLSRIFKRK